MQKDLGLELNLFPCQTFSIMIILTMTGLLLP